jgi:hypothetical protein
MKREEIIEEMARAINRVSCLAPVRDVAEAAYSVLEGRMKALEDENARLSKAVCSGILGDLLTPDENVALLDFVKSLRARATLQQDQG